MQGGVTVGRDFTLIARGLDDPGEILAASQVASRCEDHAATASEVAGECSVIRFDDLELVDAKGSELGPDGCCHVCQSATSALSTLYSEQECWNYLKDAGYVPD